MTPSREQLIDALERAARLLTVCEFDAPEDIADLDVVMMVVAEVAR